MVNPTVTPISEQWHAGGFMVSEARGRRSRDQVTIAAGLTLYPGLVLGRQSVANAASAVALDTNTGNGTIGTIGVAAPAMAGSYTVVMESATTFLVEDPTGTEVGHGATGAAFVGGGLSFTLTAGGTAFAAGDGFVILVNSNANQISGASASAVAGAANIGNGTMGAITVGAAAQPGAITLKFTSATAFTAYDARGRILGTGTAGTAFSALGLGFTITAGSTAFVAGDTFTVTVVLGAAQYAPYDPTASDGTEIACAILWGYCNSTSGVQTATAVTRECEVNASELVWGPNVTTTQQQQAALASLLASAIVAR